MAKWAPGPKNLEKGTPKTKRKHPFPHKKLCSSVSDFEGFFEVSLDGLFLISVAKVS